MKIFYKQTLLLFVSCLLFGSCEEENSFPQAVALKVVHAASGAPAVHINYFGRDIDNFSVNPTLRFGANERFTLPARETRNIRFSYASDTTTEVYASQIDLEAGQISTLYLVGDSANLSSFVLPETFRNYSDSVFGVNFVHAAGDLEAVAIRAIQTDREGLNDTTMVSLSLAPQTATGFSQYEATARIQEYNFQFLDASDEILVSFRIDPLRRRREKVFRNITIPLIGMADDDPGNSTLQAVQIDNF